MKTKLKTTLALFAAFCGLQLFAAVGDTVTYNNTTKSYSGSAATVANTVTWTITIPGSSTLPVGSTVRLTSVSFGLNSSGDDLNAKKVTVTVDGKVITSELANGTGEKQTSTKLGDNSFKQSYAFGAAGAANECVLTVGTPYALAFVDANGAAVEQRMLLKETKDVTNSPIRQDFSAVPNYRCSQLVEGTVVSVAGYTTSRVISMNFGNQGNAPDYAGIVPVSAGGWNNVTASGNTRSDLNTWNGSEPVKLSSNWTIKWSSGAVWYSSDSDIILKGYLDDSDSNQATAEFTNLPFEYYDIYIYKSADSSDNFSPVSLTQGSVTTSYTCGGDGIGVIGTDRWGRSDAKTCQMGTNVIRIKGVKGSSVTIKAGVRNTGRGALAAVQIVEVPAPTDVVSVNFDSGDGKVAVGTDPGGLFADSRWHNTTGASGSTVGAVNLTYSSKNTYNQGSQGKVFNRGFLDDGSGVTVTATGLKNGLYDVVIYCSTDNSSKKWTYKTVNGTNYYWDSTAGAAAVGTENWGVNNFDASAAEPGSHALLIPNVSVTEGQLAISGAAMSGSGTYRSCISAVQFQYAVAAKIGDVKYQTLAAAFEAVTAGQTITLVKNVNESLTTAKTFTLDLNGNSLTGTLTIGEAGAVTLTTLPAADTLKIAGSGRLVYTNETIPTLNNIWDSSWTGTFAYGGCNTSKTDWDLTSYYNEANSKFEFNGTLTGGYFARKSWTLGDLIVTGSITVNNGYSTLTTGDETIYQFTALKGTGSITTNKSNVRSVLRFDTMDAFTGTISLTGFRVIVGTSTCTISDTTPANSTITILDKANLTANTLTASSGITVKTAVAGTTTLASATTFADNAELDARTSLLTASSTLAFGTTTKVRVAAAPTAASPFVKVMNKSNAGKSLVDTTTVALYVGDATEPTSGNFKLAYYNDGLYVTLVQNLAAEITESKSWSQISWSGTPTSPFDTYTLTVSGDNVVLTFDEIVNTTRALTINGNVTVAMADSLYEDGCWEMAFATFGTLTTTGTITFANLKSGFYGVYSQTATSFKLRAQNKEVISINIAGGSGGGTEGQPSPTENLVTGTDYYGIAPTVGNSWNNIDRQFQGAAGTTKTITIEGPNAFDGQTTIPRPTMTLSATGKNTYQCGSIANPFLRGYLDDGMGVTVMVHGIPYTKYDVIVYATSDGAARLAPVTINGTKYTFADGETKPGATVWGQGMYATPEIGKNALRINDCEGGTLTINATRASNPDGRATLCAVQVICKGDVVIASKYVADVTAANVTWTTGDDEGLTKHGQVWASSQLSTLTLTNTVASTLTFNPAEVLTGLTFKVVSAADYKMTIPYASLAKLSFTQLDFSEAAGKVEINLDGVTEGSEKIILAGELTGADNVTYTSTGAWGAYADASGIHMAPKADMSRTNPVVTTESKDFVRSFFGTTSGSWNTIANWRKASNGIWVPATALPGISGGDYTTIMIDGDDSAQDTVTVNTLEGYAIQFAFLNGAHVTASTLTKIQTGDSGVNPFIWVDEDSSFTVNAFGTGSYDGSIGLYVAAENGITFPAYAKTTAFNYYLKGSGSVKFTGAVTDGTHTIKQMDLTVGMTAKDYHHVEKTKLVTLAANSTVTFAKADDIVIKIDNTSVTPTYQADIPTVQNDVGTYTIKTEADGVYVYVVQYADQWDIVEPLTATLADNTAWSSIAWTDYYSHTFTNPSGAHQYQLTAGDYTATQTGSVAAGSTVEIVSGTLELATGATIGTETYTIDSGATLLVKVSGITASKVTNNGTLKFEGGDSSSPIAVAGDANIKATLAAGTYVKNTVTGNHIHNITGTDATSFYALGKASGGVGFTDGTTFANLTLVSDCATGEKLWIERSTYDNVGFVANTRIHLSGLSPTIVSLSGAGEVTHAGSETLTIACTAASDYSGASTIPFTIGTCTALQTLSGAYTGALTVQADGQVKLAGSAVPSSITSAGAVTFDYGAGTTKTVTIASNTGTIKIDSGTVVLKGYRGTVTLAEGAKVGYTVNINDCGSFTPPEGVSADQVELYQPDGTTKLTTTVEGGKVKYDWSSTITGSACWWDYEFDGNLNNAGTSGHGAMTKWGADPVYAGEGESKSLYIHARPAIDVSSWPTVATFVMYSKMVGTTKTFQLGFGSSTKGTKKTIFLATEDALDTVSLNYGEGQDKSTKLCTMTVANAQTTEHLYAFVLKSDGTQTVIDIYLDGELLQEYPFGAEIALGGGFQIGSPHGGMSETVGYSDCSTTDPATLDWLRVYNVELTKDALQKYAAQYPYVSPNGTYSREVASEGLWEATDAWTKAGTPTTSADKPAANSTVNIDATGTVTLKANLAEDETYEAIKITGDDLTIAQAEGTAGRIKCSGRVTADANVTFDYDAFSMENTALTIKAGKTVTFDLSMVDMNNVFDNKTIDLTGYITAEKDATVTYTSPAELHGRTLSAAIDPTTHHYVLTVTVPDNAFVYTVDGEATEGTWTWGTQTVSAEIVTNRAACRIEKAGTGIGKLWAAANVTNYTVKAGTMMFTNVYAQTLPVTVNADAIFDLNGQGGTLYEITLAGGKLVNNGAKIDDTSTIKGITLTADSKIGGSGQFTLQNTSSYSANTVNLGSYTLTKEDDNKFVVVATTFSGTGTLDIEGGTLFGSEATTFGDGVTLKIGANGTFENRSGKTATVAKVTGVEGGTINNAGTVKGFGLSGTLNLTGNGSYGTITNAADAVANIGTRLDYYTFSGAGDVKAKLSTDPQPGDVVTIFKVADSATTGIAELKKSDDTVIDPSYYTVSNGVVTFKKEAKIGTTYYFVLAGAIEAAETSGTTIDLVSDVAIASAIPVGSKVITLAGDTNILSGAGFTFDGGSLTIESGCIGIDYAAGITLEGGRFNSTSKASWDGHLPTDYVFSELAVAVREGYSWQMIYNQLQPTEDQELLPVKNADGSDAGSIALDKTWVAEKTGKETAADQLAVLNTKQNNKLMKWENDVLGLDGDDPDAKPVVAPQQTAPSGYIDFALNGVDKDSGATVVFVVQESDQPGTSASWSTPEQTVQGEALRVKLPESGVKYYKYVVSPLTSK